jgi:peptide/nickel transport system substrate-binding protein
MSGAGTGGRWRALALCLASAALLCGCGGSSGRGGTLTVLEITQGETAPDPAQTDFGYPESALFRTLYIHVQPGLRSAANERRYGEYPPDLASGPPQLSRDGRTITVHIRRGVRFSPPVNREVTAADVRYGIERGFLASVASPYAEAHFSSLVGVGAYRAGRTRDIAGLQTPERYTLVLRLTRPLGAYVSHALTLPLASPVPREYAARFDRHSPSTYAQHVVATGPYMVARDRSGKAFSTPEISLRLVRNPNWDRHTDFRPAYLDRIDIRGGFSDPRVLVHKVLGGGGLVTGAFPPSPAVLQQSLTGPRRKQLTIIPSTGPGAIAVFFLNTTVAPLDNVNVRLAIAAAVDRRRISLLAGPAIAPVQSHYLSSSYLQEAVRAGGSAATIPALANRSGDIALARSYLRRAGYPTGRYTGSATIQFVGIGLTLRPLEDYLDAVLHQLSFKVNYVVLDPGAANDRCGRPKERIGICFGGVVNDFHDPQAGLAPTFDGRSIQPVNNPNLGMLNDPTVNAAISRASVINEFRARARAWAEVDRMILQRMPAIPLFSENLPYWRSANVQNLVNDFTGLSDVCWMKLA